MEWYLHRETHLRNRGSEDNHLVQFSNTLHELIDSRSFDHVDVVVLPFDLHRDREIGTLKNLRWYVRNM